MPEQPEQGSSSNNEAIHTIHTIHTNDESAIHAVNTFTENNTPDVHSFRSGVKEHVTLSLDSGLHKFGIENSSLVGYRHFGDLVDKAVVEFFEKHIPESRRPLIVNFNGCPKKPGELNQNKSLQLYMLKEDLSVELTKIPSDLHRMTLQKTPPFEGFIAGLRRDLKKIVLKSTNFAEHTHVDDPELNTLLERADKLLKESSIKSAGA